MAFVIALPLLLLFLFAVVDLGRSVFLSMALDDAAHAVCEAASGHPAGDVAESQLREAAFAAAPALDRDDLHLDVSVRYGEFEDRPYEHRFYNERTDAYDERTSFARSRPVEVALVLEGAYLTPLGAGLSRIINSWKAIGASECEPPLMMFIIGTGSVLAFTPPM